MKEPTSAELGLLRSMISDLRMEGHTVLAVQFPGATEGQEVLGYPARDGRVGVVIDGREK